MSKKQLRQRHTDIHGRDGVIGKETEQTFEIDDSFLPAPSELVEYKKIDERIVEVLCRMTENEQKFRHQYDLERLKVIKKTGTADYYINLWGMVFAFLIVIGALGVTAYALYLDRPWIATLFGVLSIGSIIGLFIGTKTKKKQSEE